MRWTATASILALALMAVPQAGCGQKPSRSDDLELNKAVGARPTAEAPLSALDAEAEVEDGAQDTQDEFEIRIEQLAKDRKALEDQKNALKEELEALDEEIRRFEKETGIRVEDGKAGKEKKKSD